MTAGTAMMIQRTITPPVFRIVKEHGVEQRSLMSAMFAVAVALKRTLTAKATV